ncbi:ParA family protein [Burkholderia ubonensis]|uniref:ParA family protein n=1 Tax=Burkholderia ubonensis TaxID=101571 RepID=UPI000758B886|nr:AAA family ATPase [Burkholderia ubonensis]KVD37135.1 cobyrinic acid a,c-diamide synthase [Burkholderia ubonensis]
MIIGIFNNKGGVGKTTYLYHVAHDIASKGKTVLLVDADPQCNLTAYCLSDAAVERAWLAERGNSLFLNIQPLHESMGDIRDRKPTQVSEAYSNLYLVPGDPALSDFEDTLGDTWNRAKGGAIADLRKQTGIFRYIKSAAEKVSADITFVDLGPNLGPLNRTVLTSCDYFMVPVSPDLFSIRGTQNLGRKLVSWRREWEQIRAAGAESGVEMPHGAPKFLGYVRQQHNTRNNDEGMTKGWQIFGRRVAESIETNIVDLLTPLNQVMAWEDDGFDLGGIPNLHSLVPYSQEARKPIFDCGSADGLRGAHLAKAAGSRELYQTMSATLINLIDSHGI